jgi:hypothetical protein
LRRKFDFAVTNQPIGQVCLMDSDSTLCFL